jgi:hypothetical protein
VSRLAGSGSGSAEQSELVEDDMYTRPFGRVGPMRHPPCRSGSTGGATCDRVFLIMDDGAWRPKYTMHASREGELAGASNLARPAGGWVMEVVYIEGQEGKK